MDDAACARLDLFLRRQAFRLGAPELGDADIVLGPTATGEEARPRRPRDRLDARLAALERHLLLLDRRTHDMAHALIRDMAETPSPFRIVAQLPDLETEEFLKFDLAELPDLSGPLAAIRRLRRDLEKDDDARPG